MSLKHKTPTKNQSKNSPSTPPSSEEKFQLYKEVVSSTSKKRKRSLSPKKDKHPAKKLKRTFTKATLLPKHILINAMDPKVCQKYYDDEIRNYSKPSHGSKGCIYSTKKRAGGRRYPEIYIRKDDIPASIKEQYLKREWKQDKKLCRAYVHQIAWRSLDKMLPEYEKGIDICHTCGEGMAEECCINRDHLELGDHKDNLQAIACQPFTQCQYCQLVNIICPHKPTCTGDKVLTQKAQSDLKSFGSKKITNVTFMFDDGSIKSIKLN